MKKRRFSFFPFFDPFGDFDELFQRLFGDIDEEWQKWEELAKEVRKRGGVTRGYRITIGPDGVPKVEVFGDMPSEAPMKGARKPLVEVNDKGDKIEVIAEMPGAEKDKIKTKIKGNQLVIKCEEPPYYAEVPVGDVEPDSANAKYKNGILTVELKKKQEPEKEIKIS